ncbi:MAG: formylglycine-generating enzyme family protein [Gammaproteobacteria bacterium]
MAPTLLHAARPALVMGALLGVAAMAFASYSAVPGERGPALLALGSDAACAGYSGLPQGFGRERHAGMAWVEGGTFVFGSERGYADERPADAARTRVGGFWMDQTEVTVAQFDAFVRATGYVSDAERQGGAVVFVQPKDEEPNKDEPGRGALSWWRFVKGADWRHPAGPGSSAQANLPVTQVTQADALAYAQWLGRDLPTEAEWEYAGKAGQEGEALDTAPRDPQGKPAANYWQGAFPLVDAGADGHKGIAPVACYGANAFKLYDMIGNTWEWTRDPYTGPRQSHANGDTSVALAENERRSRASNVPTVIKGGSYLCSPDYCVRYRASAREAQEADLGTAHIGFRTVLRNG